VVASAVTAHVTDETTTTVTVSAAIIRATGVTVLSMTRHFDAHLDNIAERE
jgi:hypothetical protein